MSAEKPTGVVQRLAIPQETPKANELTVLRDSGHLFCAIAVVTGQLVCNSAKPAISRARESNPAVWRPAKINMGETLMLAMRILSSPTVSASFPPAIPAAVPARVMAKREKPPAAMVPPLVIISMGRNIFIPWKVASLRLAIITTPPTLLSRYLILLINPVMSALSCGRSSVLIGADV